ncbi:hypothetical protein MNV_10055 [Candidatus Methanoperedens nitroreducens]|uniref:Uncharacterized protein n=1 Tax=Candidatus Methanoperedens nitratireducens TaxID=1392998 RepID=A0A284VI94_9EURY|nr:hypothetical protein MNV_10055 [Candidatus Methanoperedens nitroreducens]
MDSLQQEFVRVCIEFVVYAALFSNEKWLLGEHISFFVMLEP